MLIRGIKEALALVRLRRDPVAFHRGRGVRIGEGVSLYGTSIHTFGSEPYLISIGDRVTVSHSAEFVTHDGGLRVTRDENPGAFFFARISVEDGAFIGAHALILPGVTVGAKSIVGAGAIVTKDVPPGVVVAGIPARTIKTVEEYVASKRSAWINTAGLADHQKRELLLRRLAQ